MMTSRALTQASGGAGNPDCSDLSQFADATDLY